MRVFASVFSALLLISVNCYAKSTRIYGNAPGYAGKELVFYTYKEPVLMEKQILNSVNVSANGQFNLLFEQNETFEVYVDIGRFKGALIAEPGNEYEIKLPPFTDIPEKELRSPFFKRKLYWLGFPDKTESDLNFRYRGFVKNYNKKVDDKFVAIYRNSSKDAAESIKKELDSLYPDSENKFFNDIKLYYFSELDYTVNRLNADVVINEYFSKTPILNKNPKYQEVFRAVFTNFLSKQAATIDGNKIYGLVDQGRFSGLVVFFIQKGYNKEFAEMAVLKGLYDGYYSKDFKKEGVLKALGELKSRSAENKNRILAEKIIKKLTRNAVGKNAPLFILPDVHGKEVSLKSLENKYILLNFVHTDSYDCKYELNLIKNIQQRYHEVLEIVSISMDKEFNSATRYWSDNNFTWVLLNGTADKNVADNYSVKSTPAFYLIAPDGTFLLSPAPSVSKGFDAAFIRIFRNYENRK